MQLKRVLLASSALAMLAGASQAQADGLYISVLGGANFTEDSSASLFATDGPTDSTQNSWATDADTGFLIGGAVGTHLDKWAKGLKVELEASYRRNDVGGIWVVSDFDTGVLDFTSNGTIDANLSTFAVMANVWYEHDMGWKVRPYVGGGVGWARTNFNGALLTSTGADTEDTWDRENDGFAWQLGIGFNYQAAPGVDVGLGYRYFSGPDINQPYTINLGFSDAATFGRVENDNHSVMVNLSIDVN
jgi:opacity protein-like surface antigen